MKKAFNLILILGIFFVVIQIGYNFIKKEHYITYKLNVDDDVAKITEIFENNRYNIKIRYKDKEFVYTTSEDFNKQKNIIEDVKAYEQDDLICIYPIFYKKLQNNIDIECIQNDKLYTYTALLVENPDIKEFADDLNKLDIESKSWEESENKDFDEKYTDIIFEDYFPEDITLAYWNTGMLYSFSKDQKPYEKDLPSNDNYNNNLNTMVDNYYVAPSDFSDVSFAKIIVVDITSRDYTYLSLPETVSLNSFINGVVDGKVYLTDISNLKQYEISPENKKVKEVGSITEPGKYYNGHDFEDKTIYEIVNNNLRFEKAEVENDTIANYTVKELYETANSYYFLTENNEIYQIIKEFEDNPIYITKATNAYNFRVVEDNVFFIDGEYLYVYNHTLGQKPLIRSREFTFNIENKNIFEIYKK